MFNYLKTPFTVPPKAGNPPQLSKPISILNFNSTKPIIFPNDRTYRFLLKCSLKPTCVICTIDGEVKTDFDNDPLVLQALDGRINFQIFKHAAENKDKGVCQILTKEGIEAKSKLNDPKIRAFLDVIAFAEAYFANRVMNYDESSNFVKMDNLSDHPNKILSGASSSASGRYQIMTDTWKEAKVKLGLSDFTPESQDIFAAYKLITI